MKYLKIGLGAVLAVLFILPAIVMAQTVYVTEKFEINLRSGPASDRRIIMLISSGTPLRILEKGEEWSMVRTQSGKEGWVLSRYIGPNRPCSMVLARVQQDYDAVVKNHNQLKEEFKALAEQKKTTDTNLSQVRQEQNDIQTAYDTLKRDSADFIKLQKRHTALEKELATEKSLSAKLDEENKRMKKSAVIQWVLTGGGIMLAGFLMGRFSGGGRNRSY
ncbi:TIGR04211 family SH3 domain-containing protein [Desulfosarcina sp. OttesenSCG-928-A07]|nr:TIGR04211 family SH3 domain-containing protein [Desulfosarcina sp. OttesenSCG-928-G17]MDL2329394.1 TIGR04211 family SH3 domain-containing protein [Desulfosarcina sp. OttesenSCG-928-A07]